MLQDQCRHDYNNKYVVNVVEWLWLKLISQSWTQAFCEKVLGFVTSVAS